MSERSRLVMTSMRLPEGLRELVRETAAEHGQSLTEATMEAWTLYLAAKARSSRR